MWLRIDHSLIWYNQMIDAFKIYSSPYVRRISRQQCSQHACTVDMCIIDIITSFATWSRDFDAIYSHTNAHIYETCHEKNKQKNCPMSYANNKGPDQPAHPRSLISAFVVHFLGSIIPILLNSSFQDSSWSWEGQFESLIPGPNPRKQLLSRFCSYRAYS